MKRTIDLFLHRKKRLFLKSQVSLGGTRLRDELNQLNNDKYAGLINTARPLNGIWATAPYLHNGSVPSLWALLQSVDKRPTTFAMGSREFDPVHVGFVRDRGLYQNLTCEMMRAI